MPTNIGLGFESELVGQTLRWRTIGTTPWTTVDSPVTSAKYRLDGGGTYVRLQYIGPWSYAGGNGSVNGLLPVVTGNTTSSANFVSNRNGSGGDWNDQSSAPNIPSQTAFAYVYGDRTFRLENTSVEVSINGGADFSSDLFNRAGPIRDISDAFFIDSSGSRLFYANSASKKFIKVEAASASPVFNVVVDIPASEYFFARSSATAIILDSSVSSSVENTPITVSLVNGILQNAIGVAMAGVTIGPSNAIHTQVTINLGTNTNGKRRQPQGFRLLNGRERDLVATRSRNGEAYTFVFQSTVDGSNSVNLVLN